jgi:VPDSG-CTERM motif
MNKLKYLAAVIIGIAGLGLQPAKADVCNFCLSTGNSAISGFQGPFATVSINLINSTTATITFTSSVHNGNIYLFGDGSSVAANINAASFSVSGIVGTNSGTGFSPGPFTSGSGNVDGFGAFNLTINSFDGFTHSSDQITFTVTNLSGTWASCHDVLVANASGFILGAHIFVTAFPANASAGAIATGFAANGPCPPSVPDGGATVMLLGMGIGALGMVRRFLKA